MKRVVCWLRGHQYKVVEVFSNDSRRVCCARCSREWAMNDRERIIVPWSEEFARFYREFGHHLKD